MSTATIIGTWSLAQVAAAKVNGPRIVTKAEQKASHVARQEAIRERYQQAEQITAVFDTEVLEAALGQNWWQFENLDKCKDAIAQYAAEHDAAVVWVEKKEDGRRRSVCEYVMEAQQAALALGKKHVVVRVD